MNFLPIALRELQVAARRAMSYYWRSLSALNAACIALGFLLVSFSGAIAATSAGLQTFQLLSSVGYALAALAAVLMTSDCISEERRNGTLGFLFLTDLKGYDIVLGKLARLSTPVYCLVAAFPAMGFTMLLGGVSFGDFVMVNVALVNTIFFFAAFGLLVSAISWDSRAAVSVALLGVVLCSAPMVSAAAGLHLSRLGMAVLLPTPGGAFLAALGPALTGVSKPDFFWSLVVSHALGWLFLAAASFMVVRNFSKEKAPAKVRPRAFTSANPALALQYMGLEARTCRPIILLAALVTAITIIAILIDPTGWYDIPTFACVVLALHLILKYWAANSACRSLPSRRHSGELEILLTTPLDGDAILLGSTTAIKHHLLWPFLFVVAMDTLLLVLGWCKLGLWAGFAFGAAMLIEFVWFVGNLYSLTWVGLCMGLKCSSHAKALTRTIVYILVFPYSLVTISATLMGLATMGRFGSPWMGPISFAEFVIALVVCNLGFTGWAVSELRDYFRLLAASEPKPSAPSAFPWKIILEKLRFWRWKRAPQTA